MKEEKERRVRVDTATGQQRIAAAANRVIVPPPNIEITESELIFFDKIILEKPKANWTDHQIEIACFLARVMYALNRDQVQLRAAGSLAENKNRMVVSPLKKAVEESLETVSKLRRSLGIHSRAVEGEPRDLAKRNNIAFGFQESLDDDDLVNYPN